MKVVALVGSSGTGKSYKAMSLAREHHIDYLIDDGILIHGQKKLEGSSAKREKTKIAAVKRAIFFWEEHRDTMIKKIIDENPDKLLIIGTSERMVRQIAKNLEIEPIDQYVYIEDISTKDEIETALFSRSHHGKHVIPLPTLEVRKDFSGYILDKLKIFSKVFGRKDAILEKSVVRPTFSQIGEYTISNKTLIQIIANSIMIVDGVHKYTKIRLHKLDGDFKVEIDISVDYGLNINKVGRKTLESVKNNFEMMTLMNLVFIDIVVKNLHVN